MIKRPKRKRNGRSRGKSRKNKIKDKPSTKKKQRSINENEGGSEDVYIGSHHPMTGLPHGRGTLSTPESRFEGRFKNGEKCGKGSLFFLDGSSLCGSWFNNQLNGFATYTLPDQSKIEGNYEDGELTGKGAEFDDKGRVVFQGTYFHNLRHGIGELTSPDGGLMRGSWVTGEFDGDSNCYYYSPASTIYLKGVWKEGKMTRAWAFDGDKKLGKSVYSFDESSDIVISSNPMLEDPYESYHVFVAQSTISDAEEGLFAKVDLKANQVAAFYNGTRVSQDLVDNRSWEDNSNTIVLDEDEKIVIDVDKKSSSTKYYRASLGHKANHSFDPKTRNAKYDLFLHPRFGLIKCVRTIREVKAGEELLVLYGYDIHNYTGDFAPDWFVQKYKAEKEKLSTV